MQWVVMGVSASGKSTLAEAGAAAWGWRFIEGDALHSAAARDRMNQGIALTDEDRLPWVQRLGEALAEAPEPVVASASLLKSAHRDLLRSALPQLRLLHLRLPEHLALARASARSHFFAPSLVRSQYLALEPTSQEPDVLELDGERALAELLAEWQAHWLRG